MVLKRQGDTWKRIEGGLPAVFSWDNAAVVDNQLSVQGRRPGDRAVVIYRRASGKWLAVSTEGIPADSTGQVVDMAGTIAKNLWLVGEIGPIGGGGVPAAWRWTGSGWRQVALPATSSALFLTAVEAKGFQPAWIVGSRDSANPASRGLVLREK